MPETGGRIPPAEPAPRLSTHGEVHAGAGSTAVVVVTVVNDGPAPRVMALTMLGLDSDWVPQPVRTEPVAPGAGIDVSLTVSPAAGAIPARYPCAVAVQALEPGTGRAMSAPTVAEIALTVSAPGQVSIDVQPGTSSAVIRKRLSVQVSNQGSTPVTVQLEAQSSGSAPLRLDSSDVDLGPGQSVRVPAHIRVARPRLFGQRARHAFTVTAHSSGAPRSSEGSFTARPLLGSTAAKAVAFVTVVALWAACAIVFIPRIADHVRASNNKQIAATAGQNGGGGKGGTKPTPGGSGGSGGSQGGTGTGGTGGTGKGGSGAPTKASGVQFNGVVDADQPSGVTVSMAPTSLVDEAAAGAQQVGFSRGTSMARVPASAIRVSPSATGGEKRSTITRQDGAWAFPKVASPGYYLLTFAKPGYQTRRYVVDAASAQAADPLKVTLSPGEGRLRGRIVGPSGAVGGAQITITDGTNTVTTSSNSTGTIGEWSVDGLSTPSTYLVSASKRGLGTESKLIELAAGGSDQVDLTLKAGVGSIIGTISATDDLGTLAGLGGAQVTATDGTITRTATTVTSGPVGKFTLSDLPVPGSYTVTVSASGYQPQTSQVTLAAGQSWADVSASLTPSSATVAGTIRSAGGSGLVGVGLVLSDETNTYKTMTTSQPEGAFRFSGIAPGTYVLSAQLFGFASDYVTVVAIAGQTTQIDRTLGAQSGGVLPATSHIRGDVLDARTGGAVTCPIDTPDCIKVSVADPRPDDAPGAPTTFTTTILPTEQYTLPSATSGDGLLPGLHVVRISAPGYESASVRVAVPLGTLVAAPTVSLYPAPVITGQITAAVGTPTGPTCVWAIGVGGPSTPPSCSTPVCQATTSTPPSPTDPLCALVASDGTYRLQLPAHGGYRIFVQPSDPEYVAAPPVSFTLSIGATQQYDAQLHRLARVTIVVLEPSPNGNLQTAKNAIVSVDGVNQPGMTDSSGTVLITGLTPGTHQLKASKSSDGSTITAGPSPISVTYDQWTTALLTLTNPIAAVVGRVSANIDGVAEAVPGASVALTGLHQFIDWNPVNGTVTMTTDQDGCFAVYDPGQPPANTTQCPHIGDPGNSAAVPFTLLNDLVSVSVTASGYTSTSLTQYKASTSTVNTISLRANPVAFTGLLAVSPSASVDLSSTTAQVVSAAPGAGSVKVTVAADGTITWNDSSLPSAGLVYPGTYKVQFTRNGYSPNTATLVCKVNTPCWFSPTLTQLTTLTITATSNGSDVQGATFTLTDTGSNPAQPRSLTAPAGSGTVSFTGLTAGQARYQVRVQAAGYAFGTVGDSANGGDLVTLTCGGGTLTALPAAPAGGTLTCAVDLTRRGAVTGTVTGIIATPPATDPHEPIAGATVTAQLCATTKTGADGNTYCTKTSGTTFTTTSDSAGQYRLTGTAVDEGLAAGSWLVQASASGFDAPSLPSAAPSGAIAGTLVDVTTSADASVDPPLYITPVRYTVTVRDSSGTLLKGLTVSLLDGQSSPLTATETGTGNNRTYVFTGVIPDDYTLQAKGSKINTTTVQVTIVRAKPTQSYPLTVGLGVNSASGRTLGVQGAGTGATAMGGVTVCLLDTIPGSCASPATGTDGQNMVATTASDGTFAIRTVPDGSYYLQAEKDGYVTYTQSSPTAYLHTTASPPATDITLTRVTHNVTVQLTAPSGDDLTGLGARLVAVGTQANANRTGLTVAATSTADSYTVSDTSVPFGCYQLELTDPAHFGTLSTTASAGCPTGAFSVPSTGTATVSPSYTLSEQALKFTVAASALSPDTPIDTVAVTVTQGTTTVVSYPTYTVGGETTIWVDAGTYTVTATPSDTTTWPSASADFTVTADAGASGTVTVSEAAASMKVQLTGATTAAPQTVAITFGGQAPTAYPDPISVTDTAERAFTGLPPGTWTITVTGADGTTPATKTVTLVAGKGGDTGDGATIVMPTPS